MDHIKAEAIAINIKTTNKLHGTSVADILNAGLARAAGAVEDFMDRLTVSLERSGVDRKCCLEMAEDIREEFDELRSL